MEPAKYNVIGKCAVLWMALGFATTRLLPNFLLNISSVSLLVVPLSVPAFGHVQGYYVQETTSLHAITQWHPPPAPWVPVEATCLDNGAQVKASSEPALWQDFRRAGIMDARTVGQCCEQLSGQRDHMLCTEFSPDPMGTPCIVMSQRGDACMRASHQLTDSPVGAHFILMLYTTHCNISTKQRMCGCREGGILQSTRYRLSIYLVFWTSGALRVVCVVHVSASMHRVSSRFWKYFNRKCRCRCTA